MSTLPPPTVQGQDIISAWTGTQDSLMIVAYAGCGKTTLLQQLSPHITEASVLCLAFNKRNAEDLASKLPVRFTCSTMNSIGHRALQKAMGRRLVVDADKTSKLLKKVAERLGYGRLETEIYTDALSVIRMAKSYGLMPSKFVANKTIIADDLDGWSELADLNMIEMNPELMNLCRETLIESNMAILREGLIDYDDQIYYSVLGAGNYEKFPVVLVDEAQDLSLLNHRQVAKSLTLNGRLVVVGDPKQAIYAFRGASSKSMNLLHGVKEMTELPLSLTFRCAKVVVERNQDHAPGFEAAPSNLEGTLHDLRLQSEWSLSSFEGKGKVAILCRNNAPLLAAAFRMIRAKQGVTMLGRDIGKQLSNLLKKICGEARGVSNLPIEEVIEKTLAWQQRETSIARANGKEDKIAQIDDRAESIIAVAEGCDGTTLADVEKAIVDLFADQSALVVLGTGHRAKGMEWNTVVHLDPWRIPSKYAKRAEEAGDPVPLEQDMNLKYVIETRTKDVLVLANLEEFQP